MCSMVVLGMVISSSAFFMATGEDSYVMEDESVVLFQKSCLPIFTPFGNKTPRKPTVDFPRVEVQQPHSVCK